jgi:DNA (cytosine-5)-methyltransferase 1
MGYKLAGFDVVGGVEIDPQMIGLYRKNHHPRHSYLESIVDFNKRQPETLPDELHGIDVLDGSPPCSSFSSIGAREAHWGKLKIFREGQAMQVLDDLFGHFLQTVALLQPKVVIAENVRGMLLGHARGYVREILEAFRVLGYDCQLYLLDASTMGVPQVRKRVFFIANRIDKKISLEFKESRIATVSIISDVRPNAPKMLSPLGTRNWLKAAVGAAFGDSRGEGIKGNNKTDPRGPTGTLTACARIAHWSEPRYLQGLELNRIQTFPDDFDFLGVNPTYVCGMSVPPYMMQRVAREVARQLFGVSAGLKIRSGSSDMAGSTYA